MKVLTRLSRSQAGLRLCCWQRKPRSVVNYVLDIAASDLGLHCFTHSSIAVRIVLYIACSDPVVESSSTYILILFRSATTGPNARYTELCVQYKKFE